MNDTFYYKVTIICHYWRCISNKLQENEIKQLFNKNTLNSRERRLVDNCEKLFFIVKFDYD